MARPLAVDLHRYLVAAQGESRQREGLRTEEERPSLRLALKTHTKTYHDRLEAALGWLLRPLTVTEYRTVLARFYGLYVPLEAALGAVLASGAVPLAFSCRRKVPLLEHDLCTLGLPLTEVHALPCCTRIPTLSDHAHALGCLYVLEGATLGGQVISRYLRDHLGVTRENGGRFFHSYGADIGFMWQTFCHVLNETLTTSAQHDAAIASACATFTTFEYWMTGVSNQ